MASSNPDDIRAQNEIVLSRQRGGPVPLGLFSNPGVGGNRSFSWALAPYSAVNTSDEVRFSSSISLYIDEIGEANLNTKLWLYQESDPIDAYITPVWSDENPFYSSLRNSIGLPEYSIIAYPWFNLEVGEDGLPLDFSSIKYPEDTPEGFVVCSGRQILVRDSSGRERRLQLPNLISITEGRGSGIDGEIETTVYIPPRGCAYLIKINGDVVKGDVSGKLKEFGNPAPGFGGLLESILFAEL